jgi:hypothetical protein
MTNPSNDFNFDDLAKQMTDETKEMIRTLFNIFKESAFPLAKQDALDYQTVCMIEDEFRNQEIACTDLLTESFKQFCDSNEQWLRRFNRFIDGYSRIAVTRAESFLIAVRGHFFTYYKLHPSEIPSYLTEAFFNMAVEEHLAVMFKQEQASERLSNVAKKFSDSLKKEKAEFENLYSAAIRELIEIEVPASHKRIEAIINQNYLQRMGGLHGMN